MCLSYTHSPPLYTHLDSGVRDHGERVARDADQYGQTQHAQVQGGEPGRDLGQGE